jgi:hypothetical protein
MVVGAGLALKSDVMLTRSRERERVTRTRMNGDGRNGVEDLQRLCFVEFGA